MEWLLLFLILPFGLMLWQLAEALRFPLHQRKGTDSYFPPVTVLKPLKGCDLETWRCLQSWLSLDYPGAVRVLFGVADRKDPVCKLVEELIQRTRGRSNLEAELVLCEQALGANGKISTLAQLERLVQDEVVVVSDADVLAPADLLRELVAPLRAGAGLAHCFYRMAKPANLAMRLEAFATNADFWSQVLQAQRMAPIDFALGAVMATTRTRLGKAGGFTALLDYLADDYQLGRRIAATGASLALCPVMVDCGNPPSTAGQVWLHQVRWARTIRVCRPGSYFLSILGNPSIWPVLALAVHPTALTGCCLGVFLAARMVAGFLMERKCNGGGDWNSFWMAPVKDLVSVFVWASAFAGNQVHWNGESYRVLPDGKLVPLERAPKG